MRAWCAVALLAFVLSGCSDPATDADGEPAPPAPGKGVVRGVVVDDAIRPVQGAEVVLQAGGAPRTDNTDEDGAFSFTDVEPGQHVLSVAHPLHQSARVAIDVVAGVSEPAAVRVLLVRTVSEDAYSQQVKFTGFIQCGYVVAGVSSLCVNDYSTLVLPGGCCPDLRETFDRRGYVTEVGKDWSTMVFELTWTPTAQGTSEEMFVLVSHTGRTANDWFGEAGGTDPVLLRFETGEAHPSGGGEPAMVPPEGMDDLYAYGGVDGFPAAVGFSQEFVIIQSSFYGGKPPDGWSFVAGDALPF